MSGHDDLTFKFGGSNGGEPLCDCEWCKFVSPAYKKLIEIILAHEKSGKLSKQEVDSVMMGITGINSHHQIIYTENELYRKSIKKCGSGSN